jgi:hypothetical protein
MHCNKSSESWSSQRRKETKVEAFENLKFFQVWEESAQKLRREQQQPSDRLEKKIWTIGFHVQEGSGEAHTEEEISHRISLRYPSAIGSGEDDQSLALE